MSRNFSQLKKLIIELEPDILKFYQKGNKSAGVRIRKCMQDVKTLAQDVRKEVLDKRI